MGQRIIYGSVTAELFHQVPEEHVGETGRASRTEARGSGQTDKAKAREPSVTVEKFDARSMSGHERAPLRMPPVQLRGDAQGLSSSPPSDGAGHHWKAVDTRQEPHPSTIVCDGKGDVRVQVQPDASACVTACIKEHENLHRSEALEDNPGLCEGKPDGTKIEVARPLQADVEIRASNLELECVRSALEKANNECKPILQARIKEVEGYRSTFTGEKANGPAK